ncbi:MAG: segregation/condensation protein A, partial [Patescibacteria group bacterium]
MTIETPVETLIDAATIAVVRGEAFIKMPEDLYIPPEALEVFLEPLQGPLELLLYLFRKQNVDILDI